MSIYSTRKSQKNGPSGAPGVNIFATIEGGPFGEKTNFRKKSHNAEKLKGGPFGIFKHPICCKISKKLKGDPWGEKNFGKKSLTMPKNKKGRPFGVFQHPFCRKKSKKIEGGPFGEKFFRKKVSQFSLLGQVVQFGAIIFCRTSKNYCGQFVWIEKSHYKSRVSLHEAPTKKTSLRLGVPLPRCYKNWR